MKLATIVLSASFNVGDMVCDKKSYDSNIPNWVVADENLVNTKSGKAFEYAVIIPCLEEF